MPRHRPREFKLSASLPLVLPECDVLIVESSAQLKAGLQWQLAMFRARRVVAADSASEAMQLLRSTRFDLVLCDYDIGSRRGAMHLLEAARADGLLDSSVFVVMAQPATTRLVADCHEHGADGVLRVPTTVTVLEQRIRWLLQRREIFAAAKGLLKQDDIEGAVAALDRTRAAHSEWASHAQYLKAGSLLQAGRLEQAMEVYRASLAIAPDAGWPLLGLARASLATGDLEGACTAARALLDSGKADTHVAAFDVLASALDERGDGAAAIKLLQDAAAIVPSSKRLRTLGETAYRHRHLQTAHQGFGRLVKSTTGTPMARDMDQLRLVQVEVDLREMPSALHTTTTVLRHTPPYGEVAGTACALRAQAFARLRKDREASHAIEQARGAGIVSSPELPTLALAKAEFLTGSEERAIALLRSAFAGRPDFRVRQSMDNVLLDTERQHVAQQIFVPPAPELWAQVRIPVWHGAAGRASSAS